QWYGKQRCNVHDRGPSGADHYERRHEKWNCRRRFLLLPDYSEPGRTLWWLGHNRVDPGGRLQHGNRIILWHTDYSWNIQWQHHRNKCQWDWHENADGDDQSPAAYGGANRLVYDVAGCRL